MESQTETVSLPGAKAADPVTKRDAVPTADTLHRTMADGEQHGVTLPERHHHWP